MTEPTQAQAQLYTPANLRIAATYPAPDGAAPNGHPDNVEIEIHQQVDKLPEFIAAVVASLFREGPRAEQVDVYSGSQPDPVASYELPIPGQMGGGSITVPADPRQQVQYARGGLIPPGVGAAADRPPYLYGTEFQINPGVEHTISGTAAGMGIGPADTSGEAAA